MLPILEVHDLWKSYRIGAQQQSYLSLRDQIMGFWKKKSEPPAEFWALQGVDFSLSPGDTVGIIGRNGAGKSTLLKVLSQITPPTRGSVTVRGRVASLLEVGTGFHPELSGRENVFLNGAILGMKRMETAAKFDEIVAFSGVERFLDTPLKHYSSGMQLRLAFAVSTSVRPQILVLDEWLSTGDEEFRHRAEKRMKDVVDSTDILILASHSRQLLEENCNRVVWLEHGKIKMDGGASDILKSYFEG
jgi:lipopolysaccharide transport system ATP-binding protein